ncbi:MAG: Fic/DOC family protein [Lactobacillus sp.]
MSDNWIDKTLYSNGVLKNKLDITDGNQLAELEYRLSARAALFLLKKQVKISGINDLSKIHKIMFQSLYEWAGKEREGDFGKGNTLFLPHERFRYAKEDIDQFLKESTNSTLDSQYYAALLDKINYFHPFREGNGRSTKTFIQLFALQHNQILDYPHYDEGMIKALSNADIDQIATYIAVHPF